MISLFKKALLVTGNVVVIGSGSAFLFLAIAVATSGGEQWTIDENYFKVTEILYDSNSLEEIQSLKSNKYKDYYNEICSHRNYNFKYAAKNRSPEIAEYIQAEYNRVIKLYGINIEPPPRRSSTGNPQFNTFY